MCVTHFVTFSMLNHITSTRHFNGYGKVKNNKFNDEHKIARTYRIQAFCQHF